MLIDLAKPFRIPFLKLLLMFQQRDRTIKPTYQLGRITFSITNCDAILEREFQLCLPSCNDRSSAADRVYDAQKDSINNIVDLINHVHKRHEGTLWILGAAVVSPAGHKILISGPSHAGKSTTSMALVLGSGWKVLSEDITHIDLGNDEIINFASPFAVKRGTIELIKDAVENGFGNEFNISSVEPCVWIPLGENSLGHNLKAPFDLIFYFDDFKGGKFSCDPMPVSEYIRAILPTSNIARLKEAASKIYEYAPEGRCYRISEGSLHERLDKIHQLCAGNTVSRDEGNS